MYKKEWSSLPSPSLKSSPGAVQNKVINSFLEGYVLILRSVILVNEKIIKI
jgi:hypothetical protein